jgi:hypothetical protein
MAKCHHVHEAWIEDPLRQEVQRKPLIPVL